MLLFLEVGRLAGISVREADLAALSVQPLGAAVIGVAIVLLGSVTIARLRRVAYGDAMAKAGLFGVVSAATLAAGMAMLDAKGIAYEDFIGKLYLFMNMPALVTAIVLGRLAAERRVARAGSALLLGLALGLLARPESVYKGFYVPLFRGLLSVLLVITGFEAWVRLSEMWMVAFAYVLYGRAAPLLHGALGLAVGVLAHQITGFSLGGVVLLAVMAASSSNSSGPPTLRGAQPEANPSACVGASPRTGTPVATLSIPFWIWAAGALIGG